MAKIDGERCYLRIVRCACLALPLVLYFGTHVAVATQLLWPLIVPSLLCLGVIDWACRQVERASGTAEVRDDWTTIASRKCSTWRRPS